MSIRSSPVSQCLEKKLVIFGFEVPDIIAIFLSLSLLNFLFGMTTWKPLLVWLPTATLALILRLGKRGKPDGYLVHWIKYQLAPRELSAFHPPTHWISPPRLSQK